MCLYSILCVVLQIWGLLVVLFVQCSLISIVMSIFDCLLNCQFGRTDCVIQSFGRRAYDKLFICNNTFLVINRDVAIREDGVPIIIECNYLDFEVEE